MPISDSLLPEFDHEMANTRRTLERVPQDKFDWRPHPRSNTFGWLATHLANIPNWAAIAMAGTSFDIAPANSEPPRAAEVRSSEELLATFDRNRDAARAAIVSASDEALMAPWSLLKGGEQIFQIPRVGVLRTMVMNHIIHHRGQLSLYLRLNDIPVPALYGPSADEG